MGRAGAPGPSTAQAPKGKGFASSAGPWRVHCPMHPARSAVAPGALEIGHGPLPQLSGTTVQLQPLRQDTAPRWPPGPFPANSGLRENVLSPRRRAPGLWPITGLPLSPESQSSPVSPPQ